jgi:hypothetical protein
MRRSPKLVHEPVQETISGRMHRRMVMMMSADVSSPPKLAHNLVDKARLGGTGVVVMTVRLVERNVALAEESTELALKASHGVCR